MISRRHCLAALTASAAAASLPLSAQTTPAWPAGPIKLILPYPPGGATDKLARLVSTELSDALRQSLVVDNKPGATGVLGSSIAAKSPPDGHTFVVGFLGSMVMQPLLNSKLAYEPLRDFTPIARMVTYDFVLVARPSLAASDLKAVVAMARSGGPSISYGTTGVGSPGHLAVASLAAKIGIPFNHVPYKGEAPMVQDMLGNNLELGLMTLSVAAPFFKSGQLKPIAIASMQRVPTEPDIPTFGEAGFPDSSVQTWAGVLGPKGVPTPVVERLSTAIAAVLQRPALQANLLAAGFTPAYADPAGFSKLIKDELARYRQLIRIAGVAVE